MKKPLLILCSALLAAGGVIAVPAAANASTTTFYWSRATVEAQYSNLANIRTGCKITPLPWPSSLACTLPIAAEVITQAHYQHKRIKIVYHDCGFNYCSYTEFTAVN